jgi:hypothetical protein
MVREESIDFVMVVLIFFTAKITAERRFGCEKLI